MHSKFRIGQIWEARELLYEATHFLEGYVLSSFFNSTKLYTRFEEESNRKSCHAAKRHTIGREIGSGTEDQQHIPLSIIQLYIKGYKQQQNQQEWYLAA